MQVEGARVAAVAPTGGGGDAGGSGRSEKVPTSWRRPGGSEESSRRPAGQTSESISSSKSPKLVRQRGAQQSVERPRTHGRRGPAVRPHSPGLCTRAAGERRRTPLARDPPIPSQGAVHSIQGAGLDQTTAAPVREAGQNDARGHARRPAPKSRRGKGGQPASESSASGHRKRGTRVLPDRKAQHKESKSRPRWGRFASSGGARNALRQRRRATNGLDPRRCSPRRRRRCGGRSEQRLQRGGLQRGTRSALGSPRQSWRSTAPPARRPPARRRLASKTRATATRPSGLGGARRAPASKRANKRLVGEAEGRFPGAENRTRRSSPRP